jgi:phage baseplate assembly protein V
MSATAVSRTRSTDKRFYGVVEGIVTEVNDSEGKEGRVKVQFPWFDGGMETEWCRVRQSYAGNGYGAFFVPEAGDEVLVAFIQGDMRLPIILGGLYNGKDKPPSHRSPDRDQKLIRTKGQHELLFDDTQGKQRVRIRTNGGHTADLSDVDKKITLESSSGQTVVVDDSTRTITLQTGTATMIIDGASGNIELRGGGRSLEMRDGKVQIS